MPVGLLDAAARCLGGRSIDGLRGGHSGDRLRKMADLLTIGDRDELYRGLLSLTRTPEAWVQGGAEAQSAFTDPDLRPALSDPVRRMMYFDMIAYLPDDILVKVDRASMAVSLEARAPLLDHRVAELAWKLPLDFLRRDGVGKWPLRQLVTRHIPPALVHRPKQGFAMPVGEWLRGPLRDWAENLLDAGRLAGEGFLRPEPIRAMWGEHLAGRRQFGPHLWTVAMFQAWRETWSAEASPTRLPCADKAA
jgi:asparagine synthase (glutamine-hydrolysing)